LIRYLDQFEELKTIAKTDDKTALGYLKRGISVKYMRQMFGTPNAVPDTYKELMEQLQALANNMDLAWGFQQSLTKPHV
jgi:RecA-family ATPase